MPLIENVLKPLAKICLIPLGLKAGKSPIDAAIHNKRFVSGTTTLVLVFLIKALTNIMKIIKSLKESVLPINNVSVIFKKRPTFHIDYY